MLAPKSPSLVASVAKANRSSPTHANQFLQTAQFMVGFAAENNRPVGFGDLGDVDITARIGGDAVRRDELAETFAHRLRAEVGQDLAFFGVDDSHAWTEVGHTARQRAGGFRAQFTDDAERTFYARHEQTERPRKIIPLTGIFA